MIFLPEQKFKNEDILLKLQAMSVELDQYSCTDKDELMSYYIDDRLQKSTNVYLQSIKDSLDYLKSKRGEYLLMKIRDLV